ncbi:MAG: GGDEF domain-containing protein [Spirulinaceae cyanobacterium RM2_2_10]|nr:GGDEF domain-containing protein [Spirulinaceae cyanobacterium SM2_1_0]NJO20857.1 GGDEF domain-containing protein [Spirulinaceae cyanobacterium RM2_2_10]
MQQRIFQFLDRLSPLWLWVLSIVLCLSIWAVDRRIRIDLVFSIFYLLPVATMSWFLGWWQGLVTALLCTLFMLNADLHIQVDRDFVRLLPYWNAGVRLASFTIFSLLFFALRQSYEREYLLARRDGLTNLLNSRSFLEILASELQRARRQDYSLTLAYMDLDNFKQVNDHQGHAAGDQLLQVIAHTLLQQLRCTDYVARLGGDEFAILLVDTDEEQALLVLQRLHTQLQKCVYTQAPVISFSIGAVSCRQSDCSADELVNRADALMYQVKRAGKNAVVCQTLVPQLR